MTQGDLPLPRDGEVHLWYVLTAGLDDPSLLARYHELLDESEWVRHQRFLVERPRLEFLVARALARTTLSRYAAIAPDAWRFRTNAWGRPEIAAPEGAPPLRFNLSHTDGLIACVVADRDAGVDVERLDRARDLIAIADRFFSPLETAALHALPAPSQHHRFFEYWTLKESYIKARGMGLALPLDGFSFLLAPPAAPRIEFADGFDDQPARWRFTQLRLTARHLLAVAIADAPALALTVRSTVPLVE